MRYAQIRSTDISNGNGIGVSLFVQGCKFHCKGCFNYETWDFNGGKEWNEDIKKNFLELASKSYIKRISILGGEPLASQNLADVLNLVQDIRNKYPNKTIWLYTGYTWEEIWNPITTDDIQPIYKQLRQEIIRNVDIVVDGRYEEDKRDVSLHYRGSNNQRIINVKENLKQNKIILENL